MFWVKQNEMLNVHWAEAPIPLYHWVTRRKIKKATVMDYRRRGVKDRELNRTAKPHLIDTVGGLVERLGGDFQWPARRWQRCTERA